VSLHVVKDLLDGNFSSVHQTPTVHNSIATLSQHILLGETVGSKLKVTLSKPVTPAKMREFGKADERRRRHKRRRRIGLPPWPRAPILTGVHAGGTIDIANRAPLAHVIVIRGLAERHVAQRRPGRVPARVLVLRREARVLALVHCLREAAAAADPVDGDLLGVDGDLRLPHAVHGSLGPPARGDPNADHQQDGHEEGDHADGNPDPEREAKNRPLHLRAQIAGTHCAVRLKESIQSSS